MGLLVEGKWQDRWYETQSSGGRFIRTPPAFRRQIAADGSADFPAVSGRYHLYVAYACPWARLATTRVVRSVGAAWAR